MEGDRNIQIHLFSFSFEVPLLLQKHRKNTFVFAFTTYPKTFVFVFIYQEVYVTNMPNNFGRENNHNLPRDEIPGVNISFCHSPTQPQPQHELGVT